VGRTCGTHERGEVGVQGFGGKGGRKETTWETQGVDGIRMDLREIGWGSVDWIRLAQDRDRRRASGATELAMKAGRRASR
jgi:hypothetical protein